MTKSVLFKVGTPVFLEKEFSNSKIKYETKVLGWSDDSFLFTELPFINGTYPTWNSGTSFTGKFISNDTAYIFRTTLIKIIHQPLPLAFFNFPMEILKDKTRKHDRIQTFLKGKTYPLDKELNPRDLDFISEEDKENSIILNLSRRGGLVEIPKGFSAFSFGENVGLDFMLPNGESVEKLICQVRNIRIEAKKKVLGLEFVEKNMSEINKIDSFFDKYEL